MFKILIVDDEKVIRQTLRDILEYEGYQIDEAENGQIAIDMIKDHSYDAVLCDIKMPKVDGIEVLEKSMDINPDIPFIMISGHGTIDIAVEATKKGAYAFITKPPDLNQLLLQIRNALDRNNLIHETKVLKRKISRTKDILGESSEINDIKATIEKVAPTDARVLITGENGTGKELVARWIHEKSLRANSPLVEVNCAAIPSELIESELFGHEKGSFTSAIKQRIGKFELATEGTLFLDEIGDMSLSAQSKVLRALQEKVITRVGGEKAISVNPRVIVATNKNLREEIDKGNFREDLYHRLSVIVIRVPPLNERLEDIPILSENFLKEILEEHGMSPKTFTTPALNELKKIKWTGNVRELHNAIERMAILCQKEISDKDVQLYAKTLIGSEYQKELNISLFKKLDEFREQAGKVFLREKLKLFNWDLRLAAKEVGIDENDLQKLIEKYNINKD
jgi:two-component system, NtrC family, nitrogen regulation response regulator NtrX